MRKHSLLFVGEDLSKERLKENLDAFSGNQILNNLKSFFKENDIVSIGFVKKKSAPKLKEEIKFIEQKIDLEVSHFVVLVEYENPNISDSQEALAAEESFMISPDEFIRYYEKDISTNLCYHFMVKAMEDKGVLEQIIIHQIEHPNPFLFKNTDLISKAEVIMPHRGDLNDLEVALWYLEKQIVRPQKLSVCFDEDVTNRHFDIAEKNKSTRFFVNHPSGLGPYPSRDILARTTEEEIILFHDSDDISTSDRTATLIHSLSTDKLDAVGSHELRIDKIEQKVVAVRFPLKVIRATSKGDQHPIFFPTTAIKKSAYLKAGGLSTVRKHSSDSQFYRRAYYFLNIENVDEFLYIRVKHANSLTTRKATALGSIIRERLKTQWVADFIKVQNRNISLLESTLIDEYGNIPVDVIPLTKKHQEKILNWQILTNELKAESLSTHTEEVKFPDANDIIEERLLDYKFIKDPGTHILKQSFSWRIGWTITRLIKNLLGWIPFVRNRM